MNRPPHVYAVLALVFVASAGVGLLLPAESTLREISAVPALGALFAAVFQVFRDQAAYERQLLLQSQQQAFSLGAASRMATLAFEKHAEFCEKYVAEVNLTIYTLIREGPTRLALDHASRLVKLKAEYSAWLTKDIHKGLEPFEAALREIGALSGLVDDLRGTGDPGRADAVRKMYAVFKRLMQLTEIDDTPSADATVEAVQTRLRSILGIEELTLIRQRLVAQALASSNAA
jgi:hypothetical protein